MKVTYFPDTDTLLVNFSERPVARTQDLGENVLIELDDQGNLVSMTIEHAKQQMNVTQFSCQLVAS
jgi:uncharacterized protein YuzE